jgi:hypothetical protein
MAAISSTAASTPSTSSTSRGPFVVPVAPTSLPKIAEFRAVAQPHITEWELKSELAREVRDDDRAVERFLIARKFDINAALQMWLDAMKWRDDLKLDTVLHHPHPNLLEIRAAMDNHCEHKFDNFGRPIYIEWVGKLDVNKVLPTFNMDHVMEYQFHATEFRRKVLFPRGAALTGKPVDQIVSIVDLKGIEFGKHLTKPVYEFIKKLSACNQAYYPEFLGALYIINAPTIFRIAWVIIRPWLDSRTQSKIQILSDDGHTELLKIMSPDSLPSAMKGRCQCRVTPLVRQCAGTSMSFKPKKGDKKSITAAEAAAAVEFDCANSSFEQQAYFTVAMNGLAAHDPSLLPRPVAPTLLVTPTRTPSPSSMSAASEAETSMVSSASMSDMSSPKSPSESSSSVPHSSSMSSLPPLSTTPPPQLSAAPSSPTGVPLIPSPAPPVLDEAEYHGYSTSAPSTPSPTSSSSKQSKKQQAAAPSTTTTSTATNSSSTQTNGSTSQKSNTNSAEGVEGIPSTTAVQPMMLN